MELDAADIERMQRILRHRLLNIISGVKSANSMLAGQLDDRLTPRERDYFPLIQNECDQVSVIVNRMDELFGPLPASSPVPLGKALDVVSEELRTRFPMADIRFAQQVEDPARPICAKVLQRVLVEAVGNAYEISRKPVEVGIEDVSDGACCVSVLDRGDPAAGEVCEMVFEPFYCGRTKHLGIGLTIAARMIKNAGGSASFKALPNGNRVDFVLPYIED